MASVKVLTKDFDGLGDLDQTYKVLKAEDVELDPPVDGYGFVQDWIDAQGGTSTDHHASYYCIDTGSAIQVVDLKQMVVYDQLKVDGDLTVTGQLVIFS